jgi:hypothetical protein
MKYVDEFRDPGQAKKILKAIEKLCSVNYTQGKADMHQNPLID